jgi:hypothetical protein
MCNHQPTVELAAEPKGKNKSGSKQLDNSAFSIIMLTRYTNIPATLDSNKIIFQSKRFVFTLSN